MSQKGCCWHHDKISYIFDDRDAKLATLKNVVADLIDGSPNLSTVKIKANLMIALQMTGSSFFEIFHERKEFVFFDHFCFGVEYFA